MHRMNCKLCHEASLGYFKLHNTSSPTGSAPNSKQAVGHRLEAIVNNKFKMLTSNFVSRLKRQGKERQQANSTVPHLPAFFP